MHQSTEQQRKLDRKGDGDIAMLQKAKGDNVGRGGGVGSKRERQGGNAKVYNAGEEEADFFFM
jgi:hypothetical protein